jgi:cyclopropane fatty-acyl-phospholipid synthase-like methyltransferase
LRGRPRVDRLRDMSVDLPPLHEDLTFHGPLSEARAHELVGFLSALGGGCVVDVGCGWAELLLRVLESNPALTGIGIDLNQADISHGQALAERRGLRDRVRLVVGDVSDDAPTAADGVICIGSSQVWGTEGTVDMDYSAALTALRRMVPRGGRVVYGDAVWTQDPTPAATKPLGGSLSEFKTLPEVVDIAVASGFRPFGIAIATLDEWDAFESGYARGYEKWLTSHDPSHLDYQQILERADRHRDDWLRGYRHVLGLAYLQLVAC